VLGEVLTTPLCKNLLYYKTFTITSGLGLSFGTTQTMEKEELPEQWKELIIVPIYKKGDKTDSSNYRGISLLPTTYKILSNILLPKLIPYAEGIIGDYQCGFQHNESTTDHMFCICQILEKKIGIK
jgi:hypothetical protein